LPRATNSAVSAAAAGASRNAVKIKQAAIRRLMELFLLPLRHMTHVCNPYFDDTVGGNSMERCDHVGTGAHRAP
jgi:hypothetical protein